MRRTSSNVTAGHAEGGLTQEEQEKVFSDHLLNLEGSVEKQETVKQASECLWRLAKTKWIEVLIMMKSSHALLLCYPAMHHIHPAFCFFFDSINDYLNLQKMKIKIEKQRISWSANTKTLKNAKIYNKCIKL